MTEKTENFGSRRNGLDHDELEGSGWGPIVPEEEARLCFPAEPRPISDWPDPDPRLELEETFAYDAEIAAIVLASKARFMDDDDELPGKDTGNKRAEKPTRVSNATPSSQSVTSPGSSSPIEPSPSRSQVAGPIEASTTPRPNADDPHEGDPAPAGQTRDL